MTSAYSGLFRNISFIRFPVSSFKKVPMLGFRNSCSCKQFSQIVSNSFNPNIFATLLKSLISSSISETSSGKFGNPKLGEKCKKKYVTCVSKVLEHNLSNRNRNKKMSKRSYLCKEIAELGRRFWALFYHRVELLCVFSPHLLLTPLLCLPRPLTLNLRWNKTRPQSWKVGLLSENDMVGVIRYRIKEIYVV